jgi:predicted transcriptional regulator
MIGIQISSARSLLSITQKELGIAVGLSETTIKKMEGDKYDEFGRAKNLNKIKDYFEKQGIVFVDDKEKIGSAILKKKIKK